VARITPEGVHQVVQKGRARLDAAHIDWRSAPIEARYRRIAEIQDVARRRGVSTEADTQRPARSSADHKVWGLLIFVAIMTLMFQTIFTFAEWPMKAWSKE